MTFDKQVKEAKVKQLQSRIIRDVIFIVLGITFLLISILISYNNANNSNESYNQNKTNETKKN